VRTSSPLECLTLSDIKGDGHNFFFVHIENKIQNAVFFEMKVGNGKDQVGNSRSVARSLDFDIAPDWLNAHFPVKVVALYLETVVRKFSEIKTQADNYRKLGMHAGEIP
jgi:hypothetical protein